MMEALLLAKLFGCYLFMMGLVMVLRPNRFIDMVDDMIKAPASLYSAMFVFILLGLYIILTHNVWVMHWPVLITMIGWYMVIKWVSFFVFPDRFMAYARCMNTERIYRISGFIILLLALALLYFGFEF